MYKENNIDRDRLAMGRNYKEWHAESWMTKYEGYLWVGAVLWLLIILIVL